MAEERAKLKGKWNWDEVFKFSPLYSVVCERAGALQFIQIYLHNNSSYYNNYLWDKCLEMVVEVRKQTQKRKNLCRKKNEN